MSQYIRQILVSTSVLAVCAVGLAACGQKGALMLPTEPAAAQRATLQESMRPRTAATPATSAASAPGTTDPTTRKP